MDTGVWAGTFDPAHAAIMASHPDCALYHSQIELLWHNRKTVPLEPGTRPGFLFLKWPLLTPPGASRHPPLPSPVLAGEGRGGLGGDGRGLQLFGL